MVHFVVQMFICATTGLNILKNYVSNNSSNIGYFNWFSTSNTSKLSDKLACKCKNKNTNENNNNNSTKNNGKIMCKDRNFTWDDSAYDNKLYSASFNNICWHWRRYGSNINVICKKRISVRDNNRIYGNWLPYMVLLIWYYHLAFVQ